MNPFYICFCSRTAQEASDKGIYAKGARRLHLVDNSFSLIGGSVFLIAESDSKSNSSPRPPSDFKGGAPFVYFENFGDRWFGSRAQNGQETQRQIRLVSLAPYGPKGLGQLTV